MLLSDHSQLPLFLLSQAFMYNITFFYNNFCKALFIQMCRWQVICIFAYLKMYFILILVVWLSINDKFLITPPPKVLKASFHCFLSYFNFFYPWSSEIMLIHLSHHGSCCPIPLPQITVTSVICILRELF